MADVMGLGGMGAAAGAGAGLHDIFDQRMQMARLAQDEALNRLRMQEVTDARAERLAAQQEAQQTRADTAAEAAHQKRAAAARLGFPMIPTDRPLTPATVKSYTDADIPPESFAPVGIQDQAPPPMLTAPDQPQGPQPVPGTIANSPRPSGLMLHRLPTTQETQQGEQKAAQQKLAALFPIGSRERAAIEYETATGKNAPTAMFPPKDTAARDPLVQVDEGGKPVFRPASEAVGSRAFHQPQAPAVTVVQGPNGPMLVDKRTNVAAPVKDSEGAAVGRPLAAQTQTRMDNAKNVLAHVTDIEREADEINKLGLMGPVGGRWADFMAGKVGAGELAAGNPQAAELLGQFRADVGLLKSGMAMVHGGARGGGSPAIMARMDALINADKMDLPLFKGATGSFKKWLTQYAGGAGEGAPATKPTAAELIKKYGGGD